MKASGTPETALYAATLLLPAGLDEDQAGCFLAVVPDDALSSSLVRDRAQGGAWMLHILAAAEPDPAELAARAHVAATVAGAADIDISWTITPVDPDTNWLEQSYKALPAFAVGDFYIYGSHHDGAVPEGKTGLLIDAATAFGSGEHGTTAGCLEALQILRDSGLAPRNIIDMGTGSGILAIAARKIWPVAVLAVDNDPEAVRVAAVHGIANRIGEQDIIYLCADNFSDPGIAGRAPFDLVIANILAGPLKDMAESLCNVAGDDGHIVLSGILAQDQSDEVQAVYKKHGAHAVKRLIRGEWATLVLKKEKDAA
jgi:ribosomal protein L11 methyltransferase